MRLSRKGRFAITAMMNLALNSKKGPMTLTQLTYDQGISLSYLEQIFAKLRAEGLVEGVRGPGGGYCLARPLEDISVADIVMAIDGKEAARNPESLATLYHSERSPVHDMWAELSNDLYDFMGQISLADCVKKYAKLKSDISEKSASKEIAMV
ncbi:MAG: Rrf2 family transcriptional regulator [Gammaproteobacteria bacterium]|nr:Rrf2 family transcriptional regulator [Gammaproteobacteria bacterium]